MRVAVLGPLQVLTEDSVLVPVPGEAERLLLAVLAAGAPGAVATARLVDALPDGGDDVSFLAHLRCLRHSLEPGLPERASGQFVLRRGGGYVLAVGRSDVDALRFESLLARGQRELAAGDAAEATRLLTTALGLWRGEPYADWLDAPFAEAERRRLTGLRDVALDTLDEARGRPATHADAWMPAEYSVHVRPAARPRDRVAVPAAATAGFADLVPAPTAADRATGGAAADPAPPARPRRMALVVSLVAALIVSVLAVRFERGADRPATEQVPVMTESERLAALSETEGPLDVSLLLAVQAVRVDDTTRTRDRLLAALRSLGRIERAVPFPGTPQQPVLSAGGQVLSVAVDDSVVSWTVDAETQPRLVMPIPGEWGRWLVAAPSPTEPVVVGAGEDLGGPWLRTVSVVDGTSRLLLEGNRLGGHPVDGVVTVDGRRVLLVVAQPVDDSPEVTSRWRLIEVETTDGAVRDTGVEGMIEEPVDGVGADFADDALTLVVWDGASDEATLVDVPSGHRTTVARHRRPALSTRYIALPTGAAQLWDDGVVTLINRAGRTVQELDDHPGQVQDVVVAPDRTWALTASDGPGVFRWDVDPATGRWSDREELNGHDAGVIGADVDATGSRLFTVALDRRVIVWDMSTRGGIREDRARRFPFMELPDLLREACDVVGRDFSRTEWQHYLPDREYRPTCSDLP